MLGAETPFRRRKTMATYIVLTNFTEQGIRNVKETTKRAQAFRESAKKLGITVKDLYWTLGQYDSAAIVDAPDEASVTALGLSVGAQGRPGQMSRSHGVEHRQHVRDAAAGRIHDERTAGHLCERLPVDEVACLGRQRAVKTDHKGLCE